MIAHTAISMGTHKKTASRLSAVGAVICLVAAYGMSQWSVVALNIGWAAIGFWGSLIPERMQPRRGSDKLIICAALIGFPLWFTGPESVTWFAAVIYVFGWLAFSMGAITRGAYLLSCVLAGIAVSPAFWVMGAHAFSLNEAFAVLVSMYGYYKIWKISGTTSNVRRGDLDSSSMIC
jgi:hypothetical protein